MKEQSSFQRKKKESRWTSQQCCVRLSGLWDEEDIFTMNRYMQVFRLSRLLRKKTEMAQGLSFMYFCSWTLE